MAAGRQLQIQHRHLSERPHLLAELAGLEQAAGIHPLEHVDGAQLVQGPQPPDRQASLLGDGQGRPEGRRGGGQVVQPPAPADDLEGVTAYLRVRTAGGEDLFRGAPRPVQVVAGQGHFRGQDGGPGGEVRVCPVYGQANDRLDVMAGHRPPRRRYRRLGQAQVGLEPGRRGRRVIPQPPDEPEAGGGRLIDPAGQGQRLDEHELGLGPFGTNLEQVSGPAQSVGGGSQRTDLQRIAAGIQQEPSSPGPVSRPGRQVGGHVPPPACQVRVGGVDGRERVGRRPAQPGRERGHQHRLPGQGVPELEPRPVSSNENPVDRPGQGPGYHLCRLPAGRRQDLPVEVMPQHRRGLQDGTLAVGELSQPPAHRLADGLRDAGRGQQLLHEERHALRHLPDPGLLSGVRAGRAGGDHLRHLTLRQAAEWEMHDARPSPLPPGQLRCRGRRISAEGDDEQEMLADGVVGQILHQGHRIRVGPVQILQGDHQPIRPQAAQQLQHRLPPGSLSVHPAAQVSRAAADH